MRIAMISYNQFVSDENNGWKGSGDCRVFLLQGGVTWGASQEPMMPSELAATGNVVASKIDAAVTELVGVLSELDYVVFYVGSYGAERAIELANKYGLEPTKAVFVFCNCGYDAKMGLIQKLGFSTSKIVNCECGGHDTMHQMYSNFLNTGNLAFN